MTNSEANTPKPYGGFPSRKNQLANTAFRGMEPDASVKEVSAHDQAERDIENAKHFGYPLGTPSFEIGRDIIDRGDSPKPE